MASFPAGAALIFLAGRLPRPKGTGLGGLGGRCQASPPAKNRLARRKNPPQSGIPPVLKQTLGSWILRTCLL